MKHIQLVSIVMFVTCICPKSIYAQQGTFEVIYNQIFQTKCNTASCHNVEDKAGNLALQGLEYPLAEVKNNLYNVETSIGNQKLIYPGDPYRSSLFRLINNGLASDIALNPQEDPNNIHASLNLSNVEKELIRQWILADAPQSGQVVDHQLIEDFYNGQGSWAIDPADAPEKPTANEGFQIHLGPFFLAPSTENILRDTEYYLKYETNLPAIEVKKVDSHIGSSHHFIIYKFLDNSEANQRPAGLRIEANHDNVDFVAVYQESESLTLPEGTAFRWEDKVVLDLNAHLINYSTTEILGTDVYINVYTQPLGTANQEMQVDLVPYAGLNIPGNNQPITFVDEVYEPTLPFNINVWRMTSHTHKLAKDFNVWLRNADGTKGEHIFSASHYNGMPDCEYIGYDYQHPPQRVFSPFLPLKLSTGFIQEATYQNCMGCPTVYWGPSANNEMMITAIMYTLNTSGVEFGTASECYIDEITGIETVFSPASNQLNIQVSPNPISKNAPLQLVSNKKWIGNFTVFDFQGKKVKTFKSISLTKEKKKIVSLPYNKMSNGLYFYLLENEIDNPIMGKLLLE